ncbi:PQQ-binding-like beta-propeller repeat protein [Permianibacter sp. IMCC34836]|uniref:outer membrane protein assembly factor BamB family protein n=1 Tax=Permianibacter fluminis TaxID=2738515 RepID=UPI0015517EC9|nr:PQQ-binding-like beta-propeller repeat protein [Permianibacter fluminis]NQD37146.1 PQQ-binding-like beta-propeller repeat protein [Permianibacter fluminis]
MRMFIIMLAGLAALWGPATSVAVEPQPGEVLIGKWFGEVGFDYDRVPIGFEFRRNADQELRVYLYQPVMNFYGLDLGRVEQDGASFRNADSLLSVTPSADQQRLSGSYFSLNAPLHLQRVDQLPAESPLPVIPGAPAPRWQTVLGGAIYAPVAVADGTLYVGSSTGNFSALDAKTGAFKWTLAAGRPIHGAALLTAAQLYFVCDNGFLFALDRGSGKPLWRYDLADSQSTRMLPHPVISNSGEFDFDLNAPTPVLRDGVLYVGAGDGGVHAVDAVTGKRLWRFAGSGSMRSDALVTDDNVFIASMDGHVYALQRKTGNERWQKNTFAAISNPPALIDGKLILGNRSGLLAALNPADGSVIWKMTLWGSAVESGAVAGAGSTFYIGSSDLRRLSWIDARDQKVLWRTDVYGCAWARPALSEQRIVVSAIGVNPYEIRHLGSLSMLDRASGKMLWRWPAPEAPGSFVSGFAATPVIADKTVYVGGLNGTMYAFPLD